MRKICMLVNVLLEGLPSATGGGESLDGGLEMDGVR